MAMSLIEAIKRRDLDAARRALAADPDAAAERDEDGVSALLLALYSRQPLIVDEIARRRAELDVFEATAAGHLARVRDLVARDPGLVNALAADGFTPLALAAHYQRGEVVAFLLDAGADPNLPSRNAMQVRPIHSAVAGGPDVDIVRRLLDAGADVNVRQRQGFTALHSAARNGVLAQVELLLERGAEVEASTDDARTALSYAEEGGHQAVAARLRSRMRE